jgi:hypothetical protein
MEATEAVVTFFDPDGKLIGEANKVPTKAHGVRIPLEIVPFTSQSLTLPTASPTSNH